MPLQDLTPQLRTRLSRLERLVGLFVTIATVLLLVGLGFYVHQMAQRKGWFLLKLPYFTFLQDAAGLRVGAPVKMMGFDIGEITGVEAMDPYYPYNVYIQIRVREPYYGYLWEDSRARVVAADFLGNRYIELTKGTNGAPIYLFHPRRQVTVAEIRNLGPDTSYVLGEDVVVGSNLLLKAYSPLSTNNVATLVRAKQDRYWLINKAEDLHRPGGIWDDQSGQYVSVPVENKGYWLQAAESPALTERLEQVINTVEAALPSILGLTNQLARVLTNALGIVTHTDELLVSAKPVVNNLAQLSANLTNRQGSLGEWLLPTNLNARLDSTLASADSAVNAAETNLNQISAQVTASLINVANLTSNLNAQVQANGLILSQVSDLIMSTDEMVQGLKRHWLLRGAFGAETNQPLRSVVKPRIGSPQ